MQLQMVTRTGHPDFLDLPWDRPLAAWAAEHLVDVARGLSRHVVRFVCYGDRLYALKELPDRLAEREYRLLRRLAEEQVPCVDAVGVVSGRTGGDGRGLDPVLITRHLDFSLPYRALFTNRGVPDLRNRLLDALAELLVRLHLAGFFWGDCSLSNTLFRRDAGALSAYLVDAETGELHPELSAGQRAHDLAIAEENAAGELLDLQAGGRLGGDIDPVDTALEIGERYAALWDEVGREEVFGPDERYRIDARLRRLNELGFDVEEVELVRTPDGHRLQLTTRVVEPGHHRRRLLMLTGLDVQENQARRLLNDIAAYRAHLEGTEGTGAPEAVVAYRWMKEVFEPTIDAVPAELRGKREPAEVFHEILDHRWFLSEAEGRDVGLEVAARSYVDNVLRFAPDESIVVTVDAALDTPEGRG